MAKLSTKSLHFQLYENFYKIRPKREEDLVYNPMTMTHQWEFVDVPLKDRVPENLCEYFWKVVFALFVLPISWVGVVGRKLGWIQENSPILAVLITLAFYLVNILFMAFGAAAIGDLIGNEVPFTWVNLIVSWMVGAILAATTSGVVIGFISGGVWLFGDFVPNMYKTYIKRKPSDGNKRDSLLVERVKGWYHNYCPHIDWIELDEGE